MKNKHAPIKTFLSLVMIASMFLTNINFASAADTVSVSVHSSPKVNILLTSNETDFDLKNFEPDLRNALEKEGVDTTNITFQALEQNTVDSNSANASVIFNQWGRIGMPGRWALTTVDGKTSIYNSENTAGITAFYSKDDYTHKDMTIEYDVKTTDTDDDAVGVFLRFNLTGGTTESTATASKKATTYLFTEEIGKDRHVLPDGLYKINNQIMPKDSGWSGYINNGSYKKLQNLKDKSTNPLKKNTWIHYKFIVKNNNIKVYRGTTLIIDYTDDNPIESGSFGLINWSQPAAFTNFVATTTKTKTYSELLNEPTWDKDATHIIVNVDNKLDTSLNTSENIAKSLADNLYFIQWGSNKNESNINNFINSINWGSDPQNPTKNNGTFMLGTNYDTCINNTAKYIASLFTKAADSQYVVVGQDVNLDVTPETFKTNATNSRFPNGRWMIHHDYTYYDNTLGQSNQTEMYTKDLNCTFDKPGKYDIYFDDELVKTVYAHRAPTADFTIKIQNSNITLTSLSKDEDNNTNNGYGTGIKSEKWYYKEASEATWTEGKLTTFDSTKTYMIKLEVEDFQGATASTIKYTGTGNPVATFSFDSKSISKFNTLAIQDTSYDPSGYEITGWEWTLYKNGKKVNTYTTKTPEINFNKTGLGAGEYKYSLKVKNSQGKASSVYTQSFTVTEDFDAPEVIITPTYCENVKTQDIDLSFTDIGSGFYHWRYYFDENQEAKSDGNWSEYITSNKKTLTIDSDGLWYLHIEAFDIAGNKLEKTVGIYKIQHEYTNTYKTIIYGFKNNEGLDKNKLSTTLPGTKTNTKKYGEWIDKTLDIYPTLPNGMQVKSFTFDNKTYEKEFKQPSGNKNVDINVYPVDYKITYNLNGGTNNKDNPSTYNVFYGVTFKNPTRDGYKFTGWTVNGQKIAGINEGVTPTFTSIDDMYNKLSKRQTGNITITANWEPIKYMNEFNYYIKNGNSEIKFMTTNTTKEMDSSFTINKGYVISPPNGTTLNDTFYSDVETKNSFVSYTMPKTFTQRSHVATFKFYFTPINYNITYKFKLLQDGNLIDISNVSNSNTTTYNVLNEVKLNTPTYQTYDFDGWFLDEACTKRVTGINVGKTSNIGTGVNAYSELASRTTGNQVLYGKFRPHRIQIDTSIVSGYGSVSNTQYLKPGDSTTIYYIPASGYDIEYVELDGVKDSSLLLSDKYTFQNTNVSHTVNVKFKITKTKLAEITNLAFNWIDLNIE